MEQLITLNTSVASGSSSTVYWTPPNATDKYLVQEVSILPQAAAAANATNYGTVQVLGGSTGLHTAVSTASISLVAGTPLNTTLTGSNVAANYITQANPLKLTAAGNAGGTGVALNVAANVKLLRLRA